MFKKEFSKFLIAIIFTTFAYFIFFILQNFVAYDIDDINSTLYSPSKFLMEENGRYVCNILSRIFSLHLPNMLGMHIQNFSNSIGAILYTLTFLLLFYRSALFVKLKEKNPIIFALMTLIPIAAISKYILINDIEYSFFYSYQYGYILASIFGISFLYFVFDFIYNNKNFSKKDIILISLLGFCAGNSSQIICYSTAITIFGLFLIAFIREKNISVLLKKNKITLIPVVSFFSGMAAMVFCPGFWKEVSWRHLESFEQLKEIFVPFFKTFYNIVFINNLIYFKIIFVLFLTILVIAKCKNNLKEYTYKTMTSLLPIVGVIFYYITLILGGPTFPSEELKFWLYEPFYNYYFLVVVSTTICILVGLLCKLLEKDLLKVILATVLPIISISFLDIPIDNYKNLVQKMKETRQTVYTCDKYLLNQIEKENDKITLPDFCHTVNIYSSSDKYLKSVYKIDKEFIDIQYTDYKTACKQTNLELDYTQQENTNFEFINKDIGSNEWNQ